MGLTPDQFWRYTFKELYLAAENHHIKNNLDWERTRCIAVMVRNAAFISGNYKGKNSIKETDLFPLPQDIFRKVAEPNSDIDTVNAFRKRMKDKYGMTFKLPSDNS